MEGNVHEVGAGLDPTLYIPAGSLDQELPPFGDGVAITILPPGTAQIPPPPLKHAGPVFEPLPAYGEGMGPGSDAPPPLPTVADDALLVQMAIDAETNAKMEQLRKSRFWLWVGGAGLLGYLIGRAR